MSFLKKLRFKPRRRNDDETSASTLQPQTPLPRTPAPIEVPSRKSLHFAQSQAQAIVDRKYPHRSKFELINHIWQSRPSLVGRLEESALVQGLPREVMDKWMQEFRRSIFSPSLTLERAEVVARCLNDALTAAPTVCQPLSVQFR